MDLRRGALRDPAARVARRAADWNFDLYGVAGVAAMRAIDRKYILSLWAVT
jgi:hypothetical protein